MKIMFLIGIIVLGCVYECAAQPRLVMADTFDFGTVVPPYNDPSKNVVETNILLKNDGDSTLIVTSVRVQCGCTIATTSADTILPGDSTLLHLTVTLFQGSGVLEKYVTVFSNDPTTNAHVLHFRVNIQRALQLGAGFLAFNNTMVGQPTIAELVVFVNQLKGATITAKPVTKGLSVTPNNPVTLDANGSVQYFFSYNPEVAGRFQVEVELVTDIPGYESVSVMGYGNADSK